MSNTPIKQTTAVTIVSPRAARGKRNVLVPGVDSSGAVLSFESDQDFERLHADLKKELRPIDPQEEETVLAIAKNFWRKHHLMRAQRVPFPTKAPVSESKKSGLKNRVKKLAA
jgi:hypothetical protein